MKRITAILGVAAWVAQAHVTLVSPEGGETIPGGSTFTVVWDAEDHDCVYNIYYSPDGGTKWTVVALDIHQSTRTYKWKVPDSATTKGMIRVLQDNKTGTDLDGKSSTFRVTGPSGILPARSAGAGPQVAFAGDRTFIFLETGRPARVVIEAFDARGALVSTWLDEVLPAGPHRLVHAAARTPAATVLRIRSDGQDKVFALPRRE